MIVHACYKGCDLAQFDLNTHAINYPHLKDDLRKFMKAWLIDEHQNIVGDETDFFIDPALLKKGNISKINDVYMFNLRMSSSLIGTGFAIFSTKKKLDKFMTKWSRFEGTTFRSFLATLKT